MISWLQQSFQENSIVWLIISSVVGGIVGASTKFVFDVVLPERLTQKRDAIKVKRKYSTPLLLAASELRGRLENMIKYIKAVEKEEWLQPDGYYFVSTLYVVGQLFGWLQILRNTVVYLDFTTSTETRKFEGFLNLIEKSFSDLSLLGKTPDDMTVLETTDKWIVSFWLQAIGEMMISEGKGDPQTIDYAAFHQKFTENKKTEFKQWFDTLGRFFLGLKSDQKRFRRIVAIHGILTAFINYLDPQHLRTQKKPYYWEFLEETEANRIKHMIEGIAGKFQ